MELDAQALELDTRLMLGVKQGEPLCMDLLLQRHRGPVIQFLYRMVRNRAIAEELAQNVFLRVYRSRTTYEPTAKFTSWLFRIATHVALNWLRDRQRAAVIMHKYEELEYTQIAHALSCSPQTVKSLLFRAYNSLRVSLAHMAVS